MNPNIEMPRYQSHKKVWALKIDYIAKNNQSGSVDWDGRWIITPQDKGYVSFLVDAAYVKKHDPQEGGYYVIYEDGYKSFSPAEAFESGYERLP